MAKKTAPLILVVEDDKFLLKALSAKLKSTGFEVGTAMDGDEGLKYLAAHKPDLILLDLIMPKKNGFEFLEEAKASKTLLKCPVVILTNLGQESDIKKGLDLGAKDYLVKTKFSLQQVVEMVNKYLDKK